MKTKFQALLVAASCVLVPQVQAGWLDDAGFYAGTAMNVTKVTGQLNRRLGGEADFDGGTGDGRTLVIDEPGMITTAFIRGGWKPIEYVSIEAHFGLPIDTDRIDNASNSQLFKMDNMYGVYLKPQISFAEESFTIFGRVGYSAFSFETQCYSTQADRSDTSRDESVPTGCADRNPETGALTTNQGRTSKTFDDGGFAWSGGVQLKLSSSVRIAFEYTQHFDEDDAEVIGVGVGVTYLFGQDGGEDDDYY